MVTNVTHHGRVYLYLHHIQGSSHMNMIDYAKPGPVERERNKRKGETNIKLVDFNYNPLNLFLVQLACLVVCSSIAMTQAHGPVSSIADFYAASLQPSPTKHMQLVKK